MREKAELLSQLDELTAIKEDLTERVTGLYQSLEQEKSKVHHHELEAKKSKVTWPWAVAIFFTRDNDSLYLFQYKGQKVNTKSSKNTFLPFLQLFLKWLIMKSQALSITWI